MSNLPPPPNLADISLRRLEASAQNWVTQRKKVLRMLEEMIRELDDLHNKSGMARVGGRTGSLVGFGVATGGILLAIPTGGLSLLAVLPGLAVGAGGAVTSAGASVAEWKITKDHVKTIQEQLEADTAIANEVLERARVLSIHDANCDDKFLFVGKNYVQVNEFVWAVSGGKEAQKKIKDKNEGISEGTVKSVGLMGVKVLCGFNPVITVPIDLMMLSEEVESVKKKEPAELSPTLRAVVEDLTKQLNLALGMEDAFGDL
jgi:hypothetical protein